jgi:hypothetical protein
MRELLVLDNQSTAIPKWHILGSGIVRGTVEVAETGRDLLQDRFFSHAEEGLIAVIGSEWNMRPTGFGGGGKMYPIHVLGAVPNLRGVITLGIDNAPRNELFKNNTHFDLILRSLTSPTETDNPIVAAVGTDLYGQDRENYISETLLPLQGKSVELHAREASLTLSSSL